MIGDLLQKAGPGPLAELRATSLFGRLVARRFVLPMGVTLPLAVAVMVLTAMLDFVSPLELDLSILYLVPICLVAWNLGAITGILFSIVAALIWLFNADFTSHVLPHSFLLYPNSFFHYWKAAILLATWVVMTVLMDKLRTALARSDERFSTVLEGLHASVYVIDPASGELLYANQRCRETFSEGVPLSHVAQIESTFQPDAGQVPGDKSGEFFDATRGRWYQIDTRELGWIDGRSALLKVATNVTDRRLAEETSRQQVEKLQQVSHLVTVGEMASTLAHEMNQPLAAIANYSMGCVRRLRSGQWQEAEIIAAMEKASAQAERAGLIIRRVRELVRKREPSRAPCDINGMIRDIASLIELDAEKNGVRLELRLADLLPEVHADRIMLEQAILNIARNAIEAMHDTEAGLRVLAIRTGTTTDQRSVEIDISDTGSGVPASMEGRPFEPFFTTKPGGLGMGLSICRSILEFHEGHLSASRNPESGSTFHLIIPASRPWNNLPNPS